MRQLLLLDGAERLLHELLVLRPLHGARAHVAEGGSEEAAGTAGGVEQDLARARVDAVGHEGGDGARGVVLTGVAGTLEVVEDLLVEVAEVLALDEVVEVDLADAIDDLAHQLTGLHVVVGVLEDIADDATAVVPYARDGSSLRVGNRLVLMKASKSSPVMPSGLAAQVRHWKSSGIGEW
jgi:hypothetical protein